MPSPARSPLALRAVALACGYVAVAVLGRALAVPGTRIAAIWFPEGLWLCGLLMSAPAEWPALAAAVVPAGVAVGLFAGLPPAVAVIFTTCSVTEGLLAATLVRRLGRGRAPAGLHGLALLLGAGALGRAAGACVSALVTALAFHTPYLDGWWDWWSSGVLGVAVIAPLVLPARARPRRLGPVDALEVLAIVAGLSACAAVTLWPPWPSLPHRYLFFPIVVWAALRYGVRGVTATAVAVSLVLLVGARLGLGELAPRGAAAADLVANVQAWLLAVVGTCDVLAIIADERHGALEEAQEAHERHARVEAADRLAQLGTLAAGVAHEINNPLAFVKSNVEWSIDELGRAGGPPEVVAALEDARDGAARAAAVVRDLRAFARAPSSEERLLDLREPLRAALNLAGNELRHRARLVTDLAPPPAVAAVEARLAQLFLNLLVNAVQAIPPGRAEENEIRVRTGAGPDGRAMVEIEDTGSGMSEEVRARAFEPFFTTKPVGEGTGLGLSICHGIVSAHRGAIEVRSKLGHGSTFRVLLPAADGQPGAAAPAPAPPPAAVARAARVLVVDDEPLVARAVARLLEGHEVCCLTDPQAALARLLSGEAVDAVLCDVMMPALSGVELYQRAVAARPELRERFVFLTGGAFTPETRAFLAADRHPCLQKPFDGARLRQLVARYAAR